MSNNSKEHLAVNVEERARLVNSFKNRFRYMSGDVFESLTPTVWKRVEVLRSIRSEHVEIEAKFFEGRAALELKYQKLYESLYSKRYDIVNGVVEVDGLKDESATYLADDNSKEEKGVPDFWLTAMKTNEVLAKEISERDEDALKYLKDIKWCWIVYPKKFKLEFFFDTNPYFKNSVLTKVYHMIDDDEEHILEKAIGTNIEWLPGKCLTQKKLKKKPKIAKQPIIIKTENCKSFFNFLNFFNPQQDDENDIDEEKAEELQNQMQEDFDIG